MTVKELKEELKNYSDDLIVVIVGPASNWMVSPELLTRKVLKPDGEFYRLAPLDDARTSAYCLLIE